jgi:hypothetical protein
VISLGVPFTFAIQPTPDKRKVVRYQVNNMKNGWYPIYKRTHAFVYSIEIRNMDNSATIYYSEDENPSGLNYDEIGPKASVTEKYDPQELFANTSTGTVQVIVIVKYYSPAYIKRMCLGIMEPMPRNPPKRTDSKGKELSPLTEYYYGTDKVFPPPAK